jgi:hypothetical protein
MIHNGRQSLNARNGRERPFERRCMNHCALREIRIEVHDAELQKDEILGR